MTADAALMDEVYFSESSVFANRSFVSRSRNIAEVASYSLYTFAPLWLDNLRSQLEHLGRLPMSWNSYGAKPISKLARSTVFELIQQLCTSQTPRPAIVPTADGSVQIEWHTRGIDLEIRVLSASRLWVELEDARNEMEAISDEVQGDLRQVRNAIHALSTRHP